FRALDSQPPASRARVLPRRARRGHRRDLARGRPDGRAHRPLGLCAPASRGCGGDRRTRGWLTRMSVALAADAFPLALIGVPNSGKTALFNRLTGSRQKVANYPGVTVERKEGRFIGPTTGRSYRLLDLPGAYSLEPTSLDE